MFLYSSLLRFLTYIEVFYDHGSSDPSFGSSTGRLSHSTESLFLSYSSKSNEVRDSCQRPNSKVSCYVNYLLNDLYI